MDNVIAYPSVASTKESNTRDTDLLDCYRIAMDFGWSAAERAFQQLATTPAESNFSQPPADKIAN